MISNFFSKKKSLIFGIIVLFLSLSIQSIAQSTTDQQTDINREKQMKKKSALRLGFYGALPTGRVSSTAIFPVGEGYVGGGAPIDSGFGLGLVIEYELSSSFRLFLDGGLYRYKKLVAEEGGYGTSDWVFEQTGYTSRFIGPFSTDAYFFMDATGFRIGGKYVLFKGGIQPWVGIGAGFYSWKANYTINDRSKTWGYDTGTAAGITYLFGLDIKIAGDSCITLYGDFASPVAYPLIENLFQDGWTWDNVGGNHIMAPYRFGVAIFFSY